MAELFWTEGFLFFGGSKKKFSLPILAIFAPTLKIFLIYEFYMKSYPTQPWREGGGRTSNHQPMVKNIFKSLNPM